MRMYSWWPFTAAMMRWLVLANGSSEKGWLVPLQARLAGAQTDVQRWQQTADDLQEQLQALVQEHQAVSTLAPPFFLHPSNGATTTSNPKSQTPKP